MQLRGSSFLFFSSFLVSNRRPRNSFLAEHVALARSPKNLFSPQVCLSLTVDVFMCACARAYVCQRYIDSVLRTQARARGWIPDLFSWKFP